MKVKNIMFSGVMAAILGATSANAAVTVASQGYVDSRVDAVETNITNNYLTKADATNTYLTEAQVTEQITNVVGTSENGVLADVAANKTAIAGLQSSKANAADVYSKTDADSTFATKDALSAVETIANAAATKTYVDTELGKKADTTAVEAITSSLSNYATTDALNAVKATADAAATKTYVDTEFAKYTTTEGLTTKLADYAKQVDLEAEVTARDTAVKAVDAKLADYTKTSELNSTFATDAELKAVDDKFADYTTTEDLTTTLNSYATTTALKAEEDARKAADQAATTALSGKQDSLNEDQLAAVNSGVTTETVAQVATNTTEIAKKANADTLTLLATANVPEACQSESNTCVLSMTSDGTFAWTPLTATPTVTE